MLKAKRLSIWIGLALAALTALAVQLHREVSIDKCLDNGGAWNYQERRCEFEQPAK